MDFFEEENNGEEENIYEYEAKAFERVNYVGKLQEMINRDIFSDEQKRRENLTPEERFLIFSDAISRKLNVYKLGNRDIDNILEKTKDIKNLKYKNPTAYVLGYVVSEGGKIINYERFDRVVNEELPDFKGSGVEPADVLRYARFWLHL